MPGILRLFGISIICIVYSLVSYGQTDTIYYNLYQQKTTKKSGAYYRVYQKDGEVYRFKSYFLNDSLQMTGAVSSIDPEKKHGFFKQYDSTGHVIFKGAYRNNMAEGVISLYAKNTGRQLMQITFLNNIPNGETQHYDTSTGAVRAKGNMLNARKEGEWTYYHSNSKNAFATYNYTNGRRNGPFVWLYRSGNKMAEGAFEHSKPVGDMTVYYDRPGVIAQKIPFYMGLADGTCRSYDSATGAVIEEGNYINGEKAGKWNYFYPGGRKLRTMPYRGGVLDGELEAFYESGVKMEYGAYKFGLAAGKQFSYYGDGSPKIIDDIVASSGYETFVYYDSASKKIIKKGEAINGQRTGLWYSFVRGTDIVQSKERYEKDQLDGAYYEYYQDGSKKIEGQYKNGERAKEWLWFYKGTGAPWIKAHYDANGTLTGQLQVYYENGEQKRQEVYNNATLVEYKCYSVTGRDTIYTPLESPAKFDGEISTFVGNELKYPPVARMQGVEGKVTVEFIINEDGSVSDADIIKSLNDECDREALRIINAMPRWMPAHIDGQPFKSTVSVPIVFWIPEKVES